ncbi:MAG: fluoride efflux transporter CrcB [Treponema sp.]|jgi:CrcB protein|nr:fluoride efflux transporter CrcB [Treponema sp.]
MSYLFVMLGGGLGALGRYAVSRTIDKMFSAKLGGFPIGTLVVNAAGALLIGFLFGLFETYTASAKARLFAITGFLGGWTTFSTYSLDTARLFSSGNLKQALLNIVLNNAVCIILVLAGINISKILNRVVQ